MRRVKWSQVDDVAREEQIEGPVQRHAQLALEAGQL